MMSIWHCLVWMIGICIGCSTLQKKPPVLSQKLHLSFQYDPITLDPRKNGDPVSCALIAMLYEGLTHLEPDGSISLALAESVDISKNHTKYTFFLKEAYWSNGEPITAYDFEYSWKTLLSPQFHSVNAYFLYPILNAKAAKIGLASLDDVGIYAEDSKTLTVRLEQPNTYFLKMLAFVTYFPICKNQSPEETLTYTVFSGPFILEKWQHNNTLLLKKNPLFWNASEVKLEAIDVSIISDENTALQLYESGELDIIGGMFSPLPYSELGHAHAQKEKRIVDYAGTTMCFFNTQSFPFNNLNIRKAFSYAIDKEAIIKYLCQGRELQAYSLTPPILTILKGGLHKKFIPNSSQELARHHFELGLQETGLSRDSFPSLTFSTYLSSLQKNLSLALQQQWYDTLGVSIDVELMEIKVFLDKLYKKNYHFALMSILAQYFDPMNFLERFIASVELKNYSGWETPQFAHLIERACDTSQDEERWKILEAAEKILMSDAPVAPIYHHTITYYQQDYLENVKISPIGIFDFKYAYIKN